MGNNPWHINFDHETITKISVNHNDTQIFLNRGLIECIDEFWGLGLRASHYSGMLESIDSNKTAHNISTSKNYTMMDYFLAFICNENIILNQYN